MLSIRHRPEDVDAIIAELGLDDWYATLSVQHREAFEACSRRARKMHHGQIFGAAPAKGFLVHVATSALKGDEHELAIHLAHQALTLDGSQVDHHDAHAVLIRATEAMSGATAALEMCLGALDAFDAYDDALQVRLRREITGQLPMRDVMLRAIHLGAVEREGAEALIRRLHEAGLITATEAEAHIGALAFEHGDATVDEMEPPAAGLEDLEDALVEDVVDELEPVLAELEEPTIAPVMDAGTIVDLHDQARQALAEHRYEEALLLAEHALADQPEDAAIAETVRAAKVRLLHARIDALPGASKRREDTPEPAPEARAEVVRLASRIAAPVQPRVIIA